VEDLGFGWERGLEVISKSGFESGKISKAGGRDEDEGVIEGVIELEELSQFRSTC
jgi:hypothetical protein